MIPASISACQAVITVSEFSANEIIHFFPSQKRKIFITVEGIKPTLLKPYEKNHSQLPYKHYFLCVSTFGKHKNLHTLVKAFSLLPISLNYLSLVFVGAARTPDALAYQNRLRAQIVEAGLQERIFFTDHVSDSELKSLYHGSEALVIPSVYEGFGLPIIEAQSCGCPVLCSNIASLPQIAGSGAITFDPNSAESLKDAFIKLIFTKGLKDELRILGKANITRFSWEITSAQLMEVVKLVIEEKAS